MADSAPAFPSRYERLTLADRNSWRERWDAYDTWREQPVSLVVMLKADGLAQVRAERSYRLLALGDSPHLPQALDWGRLQHGEAWLSMAPIRFADPVSWPADAGTLEAYAIAGARALTEAHRFGLLHRFIAPEVFLQASDGTLVVAQWTFNAEIGEPDGTVTGVLPYLAPEALAGAPTPSSDFYALGAVLYAMATGQPPFAGLDSAQLAEAQRAGPVPLLEKLRPDLPARLTRTIDRLLAADPAARFADGLAVLAGLEAPLLPSVSAPAVDHDEPLERLVRAFDSFQEQSGGAMVLTGPAGCGKTTLLKQFMAEVGLRDGQMIEARPEPGRDRVEALEAWLSHLGGGAAEPLPNEAAMPPAVRNLLRRADMINRLAAVCARERVVLVLEDLGAHEEEMLVRLEKLLATYGAQVMVVATVRGEEAAGGKVLARLKRNPLVRELPVHPLGEAASAELVSRALGREVLAFAPVREAIAAAAGNPFMLLETLRAMVAEGALGLGPGGWSVVRPDARLPLVPSLEAAMLARAERLSPVARHIAAVVALLGGLPATRPLVAEALDETLTPELALEFQALVAQRWLTRDANAYRLSHGLLRPVILRALGPELEQRIHARLAVLLAAQEAPPEAIARHLSAAGDTAGAAALFERAGEAAAQRGDILAAFRANQEAYRLTDDPAHRRALAERLFTPGTTIDPGFCVGLLEAALEGDRGLDAVRRVTLGCRLMACYLMLSRYADAAEASAMAMAEVPADQPWLKGLVLAYRALLVAQQGRFGEGRTIAAEAHQYLASVDPAALGPLEPLWRIARFSARVAASVMPVYVGALTRTEEAEQIERELGESGMTYMAAWPWITAAHSFAVEGRLPEARGAWSHGQDLLDRWGGAPPAQALALATEAMVSVRAGELDQAQRSAAAAVAYARANAPYPYTVGQTLLVQAEALLAAGRPSEGEAAANEALNLNEDGSHLVTQAARLVLAEVLMRRQPDDASRQLEALLVEASAPSTQNRVTQVQALRLLGECRLAQGQPAEALTRLQRAIEEAERLDWPLPLVQALLSLGRYHKQRRQFGRMQRVLMRATRLAQSHGYAELRRQARQHGQFGINSFAPLTELRRLMAHHGALDELLAHGLELASSLARADRAAVFLADENGIHLAGSLPSGVDPLVSGHELVEEVLRERHTVWRRGVASNRMGDWLVDAEVRSLLALPLGTGEGPIGVLYLDRRTAQESFTRAEVAKLESLSSYLALAIAQALHAAPPEAPPASEGRSARLEAAFAHMVEADRVRRGFLGAVSADLRHQLGELREAIHGGDDVLASKEALIDALEHAERLAEILEKGIRE